MGSRPLYFGFVTFLIVYPLSLALSLSQSSRCKDGDRKGGDVLFGRVSEGIVPGDSDLGPSENLVVCLAMEPACFLTLLEALYPSVECTLTCPG